MGDNQQEVQPCLSSLRVGAGGTMHSLDGGFVLVDHGSQVLHARTAAFLVLGPSSSWFLAATARMSLASSSGDRLGSASGVGASGAVQDLLVWACLRYYIPGACFIQS